MYDLLEDLIVPIIAIAIVVGGGVGFALAAEYVVNRPSCYAEWTDSPYQVRWSIWGGCQLSSDGKTWMPDDAFTSMHKQVQVQ